MIRFRPAVPEDADRLVLRKEDLAEARLYGFKTPADGLRASLEMTPMASAAEDSQGRLLALWGVAVCGEHQRPWLMCSEAAKGHPRALLDMAQKTVRWCKASGRPTENFIGKASTSNRRFVQRLGFVIEPLPNPVFDRFYLP